MATATDAELVSAAQAGDERAMALLIEHTMPVLYGVVGKALRGSSDVDDVVQETMFRVVRGLPSLRDPERFRAWVIAIAYHLMQDRGRSARAATALGPLVEDASAWPDPTTDVADSTVTRLHLAGERREANEAGRMLNAADQHVLTMWWRETAGQLSRAELAAALGVSPDHAAVRVQRAKAHLAQARAVVRA